MNKENDALYIHIPFCEHICDYCDFPKLQYFTKYAKDYLKALKQELSFRDVKGQFKTIYVGGGTPTSLEDDLFLELLNIIKPFTSEVIEYTFEANPESLSINKLKMMKEYGVNRISIGVESTNDKILASMNRHHTFNDVKTAISNARKIGIDNLNVDLIIGLPQVSKELLRLDMMNLLSLDVPHISTYSLTVHEHTMFSIKGIKEESDELSREHYDMIHDLLTEHGYIHYEVSNFAKKGYESKHNYQYWLNNHYYGIGMGASGYINNIRYTNTKNIEAYNKGRYEEESEIVSLNDLRIYEIMLKLRTIKGINIKEYKENFGIELDKEKVILNHISKNNLYIKDGFLIPTYNGMMILDSILLDILD